MGKTEALIVIPARGGSKGLPGKNIICLGGKPLIYYTIDAARGITTDDNICISTDDNKIIKCVEQYGIHVPFIRPDELSNDNAGSSDVVLHAVDFYKQELGRDYVNVILLQPTSPLRTSEHILEAASLWGNNVEMVVSVKESKSNPYFNLFEEDYNGYLQKSKCGNYSRRQDAPKVWEYNGAIYIVDTHALKKHGSLAAMKKIVKYVMSNRCSIDIDSIIDLQLAEILLKN